MISRLLCTLMLSVYVARAEPIAAQAVPLMNVRTFTLRHLRPQDAAQLVAPYVLSPSAGVYQAGATVPAITVRETPQILARIDSVLHVYDRPPRTIVVHFRLFAANDSSARDQAPASIEAVLREVLPFKEYRLLAEGVATANEREPFSLTMGADGDRFVMNGTINAVQADSAAGAAQIALSLNRGDVSVREGRRVPGEVLLATGIGLPFGKTVVVGTAAPGGKIQALVLVLRSELFPRGIAR